MWSHAHASNSVATAYHTSKFKVYVLQLHRCRASHAIDRRVREVWTSRCSRAVDVRRMQSMSVWCTVGVLTGASITKVGAHTSHGACMHRMHAYLICQLRSLYVYACHAKNACTYTEHVLHTHVPCRCIVAKARRWQQAASSCVRCTWCVDGRCQHA